MAEPAPMRIGEEPEFSNALLTLRITMVSNRKRLAKVGEKILAPGDEVQGYRLLRVYEDRAVFERQGNELTVYVKPNLEDPDDRLDD